MSQEGEDRGEAEKTAGAMHGPDFAVAEDACVNRVHATLSGAPPMANTPSALIRRLSGAAAQFIALAVARILLLARARTSPPPSRLLARTPLRLPPTASKRTSPPPSHSEQAHLSASLPQRASAPLRLPPTASTRTSPPPSHTPWYLQRGRQLRCGPYASRSLPR